MDERALRECLFAMMRIRMAEERIAVLYPEQAMRCPVHLSIGQEAVAVGVCASLAQRDYVLSNHRSHAHFLAKGGDLQRMVAELYGRVTGCAGGKGGSMHLVDLGVGFLGAAPIVGGTIAIAVGAAWGSVLRRDARVTVVFFGDAATEEGVFHESLNFAAVKRLPIVFVCENNFYSVYSPLSVRQPQGREIYRLAEGHGVESAQGDGNDVIEVHTLAERAVRRVRQGGGPAFLEFKTYRWREHCGPNYDDDLGYRSHEELARWKARCPIKRLQDDLLRRDLLSRAELDTMVRSIEGELDTAITFARESPYPPPSHLLQDVYAD